MIGEPNLKTIIDQAKDNLSPDSLLIIIGPTASGKTSLAVGSGAEWGNHFRGFPTGVPAHGHRNGERSKHLR